MLFPKHEASLHLTHNQHKAYYETIEQYIGNYDWSDDWVSEVQKVKALETQELWELQWYPSTPVGFFHIMGADLDVVLAKALEVEKEDNERKRVQMDSGLHNVNFL
jgi:hypothetical protein